MRAHKNIKTVLALIVLALSMVAVEDAGQPVRVQRNVSRHGIIDEMGAGAFMNGPFPVQIAQ